jgi:hypothetical protein
VVIAINLPVLAFSTAVSVICGLLCGISPAMQLSRPQLTQLVQKAAGRNLTMRRAPAQMALLVGQVALTVLLLAAGAAAMRNYFEAYTARLGFDPHGVLMTDLQLPEGAYPTWEARANYYDQMIEKVQSLPGVASAAFSSAVPPFRNWRMPVDIIGEKPDPGRMTGLQLASPGYFSTLQVPLLTGRIFTRQEALRGAPYAVVSQTFANRYFSAKDPIGRMIKPVGLDQGWPGLLKAANVNQPLQIIGIVADVRNDGLHRPVLPQVYVPYTLLLPQGEDLFVRGSGEPARLAHPVAASLSRSIRTKRSPMPCRSTISCPCSPGRTNALPRCSSCSSPQSPWDCRWWGCSASSASASSREPGRSASAWPSERGAGMFWRSRFRAPFKPPLQVLSSES